MSLHAPTRKQLAKMGTQTNWIDKDILNAFKTKHQFHRGNDTYNYNSWKEHVKSLTYGFKRQYYNENKRNPKKLWSGLNELFVYNPNIWKR
jgi:hypothetical protein